MQTLSKSIELLLQGIALEDTVSTRDGWRNLLHAGPTAVPEITSKLASTSWVEYPRGPQHKYLAVLLCLLHEIDLDAARVEVKRLKKSRLHALHQRTVKLIEARYDRRLVQHSLAGISLTISNEISNPERVLKLLSKWIETPPSSDLQNIARIDVVPYAPELDYLGYYQIQTSGILLTWPLLQGNVFWRWLDVLSAQNTFYHEIGHHALGHTKYGQDPDQEKEADRYAGKMLRRARIGLMILAWVVFWPVILAWKIYKKMRLKPEPSA